MSRYVRQLLGESVDNQVLVRQRSVDYWECPHCRTEIFEKHLHETDDGRTVHSDCGKPVELPKPDPKSIPAWLEPYMPKK